jgi:hypothetical protein
VLLIKELPVVTMVDDERCKEKDSQCGSVVTLLQSVLTEKGRPAGKKRENPTGLDTAGWGVTGR